jgi:glutaminase
LGQQLNPSERINQLGDWFNQLHEWVSEYKLYTPNGQCASYIPALARANTSDLGICIMGPDGILKRAGEWDVLFTLQSISFNSIVRLEVHKPGKPFNPMINAGAITVAGMLPGQFPSEKLDSILNFLEEMIGRRPQVNKEVFESEWSTAYRNRALAFYLKEMGYLESEVDEALEVYLKQCAIEINTEDLARIGLILAQDGFNAFQQEQILPKELARIAKALMLTCGMYNASGKFAAFVGVPAKSGVSGGILASIAPRGRNSSLGLPFSQGCGIGIYGPSIDEVGNSTAGVMLLQRLAQEWDMSIF